MPIKLYYNLIIKRDLITKLNLYSSDHIPSFASLIASQIIYSKGSRFEDEEILTTRLIFEKIFDKTAQARRLVIRDNQSKRRRSIKHYNVEFLTTLSEKAIFNFFMKLHFFKSFDQKQLANTTNVNIFCNTLEIPEEAKMTKNISISTMIENFSKRVSRGTILINQDVSKNGLRIRWDHFDGFLNLPNVLRRRARLFKNDFQLNVKLRQSNLYELRTYILLFSGFRILDYIKVVDK